MKTLRVVAKWGVVASRRQRPSTQSLECETIFNQKEHDPASAPTIFTRSLRATSFYPPSPNEKSPQRKTFCGRGRGEMYKFARVSGLLRNVENAFGPVHCIKWTVLWRTLNLYVTPKNKYTIFYYKTPVSFGSAYIDQYRVFCTFTLVTNCAYATMSKSDCTLYVNKSTYYV